MHCVCFGNICEAEQQSSPARISGGASGQWLHGEPGVLCNFRQLNVVGTFGVSHDQMHPTRLEIHRNALAEHRGKRRAKDLATRSIQIAHTLHMARKMTLDHEGGNYALCES